MKGLQWMAAALMAALLLLGTMSAAAAGPAAPSEAMARAENGDVIVTWAPPPASNIIVQTGCTASNLSMTPVAEAFMAQHPSFEIRMTGGTNDLAFTEWTEGRSDIAQASRAINAEERSKAREEGLQPVDIMVGAEAVSVLVNPDLGVEGLSMEQLRGIYNGNITTWSEVGGPDVPVERLGAVKGTNAYNLINSMVLKGDGYANMSHYDAADMPSEVMRREGGIGFLLHGQLPPGSEDMVIGISATEGGRHFRADEGTVFSSSYPLSRTFHLITDGEPDGATGSWISYLLDPDGGQAILEENGFFPLPADEREDSVSMIAGTLTETLAFHVYRSYNSAEERFVVNGTTFTDEAPPLGVNITYQVSTVIDGEESERSEPLQVFVPKGSTDEVDDAPGEGSYLLPLVGIVGLSAVALLALAARRRR